MILFLTVLIVYNTRQIACAYYYDSHWARVLIPAFVLGVSICATVQVITTAYYFGTSMWVPDWKCPNFYWKV